MVSCLPIDLLPKVCVFVCVSVCGGCVRVIFRMRVFVLYVRAYDVYYIYVYAYAGGELQYSPGWDAQPSCKKNGSARSL